LLTLPGVALLLMLAACGGQLPPPAGGPGGPSPREALDRFFAAADARRYLDMAWVFGTKDGPYIQSVEPSLAEKQMYLFACLLRGVQREVTSEQPIAGSVGSEVSFAVRMQGNGQTAMVPFVAVRGADGRWFVQEFHYEVITASQLPPARECVNGTQRVQ
jgi:hypothetical protein